MALYSDARRRIRARLFQRGDHGRRSAARRDHATGREGRGGVAELLHRAHVRECGDARVRERGEDRQVARGGNGRRLGDGHNGAAEQRLRHWARTGERNAEPVGADRLEHGEHAEMRLARESRMAVDEVLGLCLGELHKLVECLERRLRSRDQHIGCVVGQADIAEAVHAVGLLLQMRLRSQRIVRRERDGVAVGRGAREIDEAKRAGGAALVDDDHGLAQRLAHLVLQRARHDVGVAARRKRHDHVDRARRVGLRLRSNAACGRDGKDDESGNRSHRYPPLCFRPQRVGRISEA